MQSLFGYGVEPDFSLAKEQRGDRLKIALWAGLFLLFIYGFLRAFTVEMFQAYVATVLCYGLTFYVRRRAHLRKLWLWKAIFASLPFHMLYLAAIIWADKTEPETMTKAIVFIPALTIGGAVECALFGWVADRLSPPVA